MNQISDGQAVMVDERERITERIDDEDTFRWIVAIRIEKFEPATVEDCRRFLGLTREPNGFELRGFCRPDDIFVERKNLLTNLGLTRIGKCLFGLSSYSTIDGTTRGRIGVGDGTTAAAVSDTDLSAVAGSTHRQFQRLDAAPTVANGVYSFQATYGTATAQFHWQEWGIDGGTANGTTVTSDAASTPGLLNHKLFASDPGTKGAASWVFSPTITLA